MRRANESHSPQSCTKAPPSVIPSRAGRKEGGAEGRGISQPAILHTKARPLSFWAERGRKEGGAEDEESQRPAKPNVGWGLQTRTHIANAPTSRPSAVYLKIGIPNPPKPLDRCAIRRQNSFHFSVRAWGCGIASSYTFGQQPGRFRQSPAAVFVGERG